MKKLLLLLCVPLIFSCGEKKKKKDEKIEKQVRDINNIKDPCDCHDILYSVFEDMINLADGRMKSDVEKTEKDSVALINLYQEMNDIGNICEKMVQKLGEEDFYRNYSNCKYPNARKLRSQLSELGIAYTDEKKTKTPELRPIIVKKDTAITTKLVSNPLTANQSAEKVLTPKIQMDEESFDFGEMQQGESVTHNFVLKNIGDASLIISTAKGSCGCTVPEWPKEPISKGEEATIKVTFNSAGKSGKQNKTVTLVTNAIPNTKVITITGNVIIPEKK